MPPFSLLRKVGLTCVLRCGAGFSRYSAGPTVAQLRLRAHGIRPAVGSAGSVPTNQGGASMDKLRFDDLVKRVATTSRRQILNGLLSGLAAAVGMHGVDASRKRQKQQNNT